VMTRQVVKNASIVPTSMTLLDAGTEDMDPACHLSHRWLNPSKLLTSNLARATRGEVRLRA
jgi:hypothetical protein